MLALASAVGEGSPVIEHYPVPICSSVRTTLVRHPLSMWPQFSGKQAAIRQVARGLLRPSVFGLGLLQDWDIRISVFPRCEEILVGNAAAGKVIHQSEGSCQFQVR